MADPTFHLFPKLPTEIRFDIWELAFPGPRHITPILPYGWSEDLIFRPQNPATLYVNKESREITLMYYKKIETPTYGSRYINFAVDYVRLEFEIFEYRTRDEEPEDSFLTGLHTWKNWPADPRHTIVEQFRSLKDAFANTRSLEVHHSDSPWIWIRDFDKLLYEWLPSYFPRVEKITFVHPNNGPRYDTQPIIDRLQACVDAFSYDVRETSIEFDEMGEVEVRQRPILKIVITDIEKPQFTWLW
jgi:hypothetical protein